MARELDEVIAELDAAKAGLARSVKRCRAFLGERRVAAGAGGKAEKSAFGWGNGQER